MNDIKIIAEISNAYQGNPEDALVLARKSCDAGANAIKFQIYFAEEFLTKSHPRYEYFKNQEFSEKKWDYILCESKKLSCEIYADIFGLKALDIARKYNIDGYKIHSSDLTNTILLEELSKEIKKIFLSTGGSSILEIRYALNILKSNGFANEIILFHGFQTCLTRLEDSVISRILKLKELFDDKINLGYSDYIVANDKFATILPLMTIPLGISYLEKHVTLNRKEKKEELRFALEPEELRIFIDDVKKAKSAIGENPLAFSELEKEYRKIVKKNWVAFHGIEKGLIAKRNDLIMKRSPYSIFPAFYDDIIGKEFNQNIKEDQVIQNNMYDHKVLAIIVANVDSLNSANKTIIDINGKPAIIHLFERLKIAKELGYIDTVAFCTTQNDNEEILVDLASNYSFKIYRGDKENVLSRMMLAIDDNNDCDLVIKIPGDNWMIDNDYLKKTLDYHLLNNAHYTDAKNLPNGIDVEIFDSNILKILFELSKDTYGTEYLTNYIKNNEDQFNIASLPVDEKHKVNYKLTIDTKDDLEIISGLLKYMKETGKECTFNLDDIIFYFNKFPDKVLLNKDTKQNKVPFILNTKIEWKNYTLNPLVTIYITNHNYGKYIETSIESVMNQKFRDFELIIIDDGSTDNSREIIEKYNRNPKITIVYQKNKGLNVTNNIAVKLAKGKYVMRLDADDYLDDNALLVMANKLEKEPELALVFPDYYLVDKDGTIMSQERRHNFKDVTMFDQPAHGACTMIKKSVLLDVGGYSEEFSCQDGYDIWVKIINNYKVSNINLPLFYYRQHDESLTKNQKKILETRHKIVKKRVNNKQIYKLNNIAIVPIRGGEKDIPLSIRRFSDTTLLDITINNILSTENISQIILTTPDKRILDYLNNKYIKNIKIIINERPGIYARLNTLIEDTINYLLDKYEDKLGKIDTISVINFEYPFRNSSYIDNAINSLYLFDADSVISVKNENSNYYMHDGSGLKPFVTNRDLKLEREMVYKEIGGIHSVKYESFKKFNKIFCGRTTHIILDDLSAMGLTEFFNYDIFENIYEKRK